MDESRPACVIHPAIGPGSSAGVARRVGGGDREGRPLARRGTALALGALLFLFGMVSASLQPTDASAAQRVLYGSFADETGEAGGQVGFGTGVAVNRSGAGGVEGGAVYVTNFQNARVDQLSRDGEFVRAFGLDVVASGEHDSGTAFEVCEADSEPQDVCKAGLKNAEAGSVWNPEAIAVDQATGLLFIASNGSKRIDVFSAMGHFEGAFGIDVIPGGEAGFELCTLITGCKAGVSAAPAGTGPGGLSNLLKAGLAVDPTSGNLYVGERGTRRINEFGITVNGEGKLADVAFKRAFGWDVIPGGATILETCTQMTGCQAGLAGAGDGQFPTNTPISIAVDGAGYIYAVTAEGNCNEATNPCRIQKFKPDATFDSTFGPATGGAETCQTTWHSGANAAQGPVGVAYDEDGDSLLVTRKASTSGTAGAAAATFELCEFNTAGVLLDKSPAETLGTNNTGYLQPAAGPVGRVYINAPISGQLGAVYVLGPPLALPDARLTGVTDIGPESVTVTAEIEIPAPGGLGYATRYQFQYSRDGANWTAVPTDSVELGSVAGTYPISVELDDLRPNTAYSVRLRYCASQCAVTDAQSFTTSSVPPRIMDTYAEFATQTSVVLGASINPLGNQTSYYVEWGTNAGQYEHKVPAFERDLGEGYGIVRAKEQLEGLAPQSRYFYRVVASSRCNPDEPDELCTVVSHERSFETLNKCGLPNDRCFELVSPADKGPVGAGGDTVAQGTEPRFQANPKGKDLAYVLAFGTPESTSGTEVLYRGTRSDEGWSAVQLSPPAVAPAASRTGDSFIGFTLGITDDLECAVQVSSQPLTPDVPQQTRDEGLGNLFLRTGDGSYRLITNLVPENGLEVLGNLPSQYKLVDISDDCETIYFQTPVRYPGMEGVGEQRVYEWHEGVITPINAVPGPGGAQIAPVTPGAADGRNWWRAVSRSGDRMYFSAVRQLGDGPAGSGEVGKPALFLRDRDLPGLGVLDVSQSETATPSTNAVYQVASADGGRVFFLANHGLTAPAASTWPTACDAGTGKGCDLYEFNLSRPEGARLRNLTAVDAPVNPEGAGVIGVLDADADGSHVYFAARGQLVPSAGRSEEQNVAEGTYNVYLDNEGQLVHVGLVSSNDVAVTSAAGVLIKRSTTASQAPWTSRTTSDGRYLLFATRLSLGGFESGGRIQAYVYDVQSGQLSCVSCRRDGEAALPLPANPLVAGEKIGNARRPPRLLTDDGRRVFFIKRDRLAPRAVEGQDNLYQWEDGQVTFIATSEPSFTVGLQLAGASADGADLYLSTAERLTWEDTDGRLDVYDARVGGGFSEPPPRPNPCNPLQEDGCSIGEAPPEGRANVQSAVDRGSGGQVRPKKKKTKRRKGRAKRVKQKKSRTRGAKGKRARSQQPGKRKARTNLSARRSAIGRVRG